MTQAHRLVPCQDTAAILPTDSLAWQNQVNAEIAALWRYIAAPLTGVSGTNAILASSDTTLVSAITGYQRGQKFSFIPVATNTGAMTINIDSLGVKTILGPDGATAIVAGQVVINVNQVIEYDGTNFRVMAPPLASTSTNPATPAFVVQDQKAQNTAGGTATSGSFAQRNLNTVVRNALSGASLSSNVITLPAGTYFVSWYAVAQAVTQHQTRLSNITNTINYPGCPMLASASAPLGMTQSRGSASFTLSSSANFELQHRVSATRATDGFGLAGNFTTEVYSEVQVWKVG